MKYLAAYNLLVLGGQEHPSPADLERVLRSVGLPTDPEQIAQCIEVLSR